MTRRNTLLLVCAFEIALLLFVAAWSALADNENSNSWFIEGQLQKSLYEGTDWITSEFDTPGSNSSLHVHDTAKSKSRDKLDSAGVAFGYLFNEQKTALSIAYENFGSSTWESGQYTATDGRVFDNSEYPMNMRTYMLELTHIYPVTENRFFNCSSRYWSGEYKDKWLCQNSQWRKRLRKCLRSPS